MENTEHGWFTLPEVSERHAGVLKVTPNSGSTLTLLIQESKTAFLHMRDKFQTPWIHGELGNGQHVTLPNPHLINKTYGHTADGVLTLAYSCPQVCMGDISFIGPPVTFDAVKLDLKWLRRWLDKSVLEGKYTRGKTRLVFGDLPSEGFTVSTDTEEFEVVVKQEAWQYLSSVLTELRQKTYLVIVPRETQDLEWFLGHENRFWLLLSLISGWESEVRSFTGISLRQGSKFRKSRMFKVDLTLPKPQQRRLRQVENNQNFNYEAKLFRRYTVFSSEESSEADLLTGRVSSPPFETIVNNWYAFPAGLQQVVSLLLAATREDDYYLQSRLANLTQAAEATHRALYPEQTAALPKREFQQLAKKFSSWVGGEVDSGTSQILTNRFGNLNMISFNTRLESLFAPLWQDFILERCLSTTLVDFVKAVGHARNNLSHANVDTGHDLENQRYMVNLLSQILRLILLQQLGWSYHAALNAVVQHRVSHQLQAWVARRRATASS